MSSKYLNFPLGSVPMDIVAKVFGKSKQWVRAGIVNGTLDIGVATCDGEKVTKENKSKYKSRRKNYYVSPMLLYKATGYIWEG